MALNHICTNICYWNCRGLSNKKEITEDFLFEENIDIRAISETKYKPQNKQKFKSYNLFQLSKPDGAEGIAILSKRGIEYQVLNLNISQHYPQTLSIQFKVQKEKKITILLLYSPPNKPLRKEMLNNIINQIYKINNSSNNILIGGDFNAHHQMWGSRYTKKVLKLQSF
jgi:exonuclease III